MKILWEWICLDQPLLSLYIYIYIYILYTYIYYIYIYILYTYILYIYIYIYHIWSICGPQPFRSLRAHQHSSDQRKILKDQCAQTTARVASVEYRLWLPFLIDKVLNWTKLRSVIYDILYISSTCIRFKSKIHNDQVRQVFRTWDLNQQEFVQRNWECEQQCSW